jgi:methionyl aminopeptidase
MIEIKTTGELEAMRAAGIVVARTLEKVGQHARPGVSTAELDELAEQIITEASAVPSFKGYHGFPASICASVNQQIVHGIPARDQILTDGDLLSVDCGAILEGWHGDAAVTLLIGTAGSSEERLSAATKRSLEAGITAVQPGGRLTDISYAVEKAIHDAEIADGVVYGIVREYGGHGIGSSMHMDPFLPNYGRPGRGPRLRTGMAIAIEPMLTAGTEETKELADGWTVVTADGQPAAHWEHTIAVTDDGPWVLTAPESA